MKNAQAESQMQEYEDWQAMRKRAYMYQQGQTKDETDSYFSTKLMAKIATGSNNITKRITQRISQVYQVAPDRFWPDQDNSDKLKTKAKSYQDVTGTKNASLQRAEELTNLLKLIAIKVTTRQGRLEYDVIRDFIPLFEPGGDKLVPAGIMYPLARSANPNDTDAITWALWTKETYFKFVKGGDPIPDPDNPENKNKYGIVPVAWVFADGRPESSFTDIDPAMDIVETNLAINLALTELNANIRFQSMGYGFLSGVNDTYELTVSQDEWNTLPSGADAKFVTPPKTIDDIQKAVRMLYLGISLNYGLDSSFVEGTTQESGISRKMRNLELMENRVSSVTTWREAEHNLFTIEQAVAKADLKLEFPDGLSTDFKESEVILTEQEKRDKNQYEIDQGYTNPAATLHESDKDGYPTEEKAKETIITNLAITAEIKAAATVEKPDIFADALNETPPGT
jgi:hypothetical protein